MIHLCKSDCGALYSGARLEGKEMKRTGALRVLGLWISPMGDRAEGALIASDGTAFELRQSEVLELGEPERVALSIGGQKAAQVAEDCAAQLSIVNF